jgi:hypothetical protein
MRLLLVMRAGIAKARQYGFRKQSDLCRFADIALVMGADFDTGPSMPWASAILNNHAISNDVRIELLEAEATNHLRTAKEPRAEIDLPFSQLRRNKKREKDHNHDDAGNRAAVVRR